MTCFHRELHARRPARRRRGPSRRQSPPRTRRPDSNTNHRSTRAVMRRHDRQMVKIVCYHGNWRPQTGLRQVGRHERFAQCGDAMQPLRSGRVESGKCSLLDARVSTRRRLPSPFPSLLSLSVFLPSSPSLACLLIASILPLTIPGGILRRPLNTLPV